MASLQSASAEARMGEGGGADEDPEEDRRRRRRRLWEAMVVEGRIERTAARAANVRGGRLPRPAFRAGPALAHARFDCRDFSLGALLRA
jgi:hypothetical protein